MRNTTFKMGVSMFVAVIFLLTSMGPSVFAAARNASGNFKLNFNSPPTFRAGDTNQSIRAPKPLGMLITIPNNSATPYKENVRFEITGSAVTVNKFYLTSDANATVSAVAVPGISVIAHSPKPLPPGSVLSVPVHIGIVSGSALAIGEMITITATTKDSAYPTAIGSTVIKVIGKSTAMSSSRSSKKATSKPAAKPAAKPEEKPKQTEKAPQTVQTPAESGKGGVDMFKDINPADWFRADVEYAVKSGLFNGTSADKFSPYVPITRGMIVTVLGRLSGISESSHKDSGFRDVAPGQYYSAYVEWAGENGIVNGVGNNMFAPNDNVTRQDFAVLLSRYAKLSKTIPGVRPSVAFSDEADIADYAKQSVQSLYCGGIINGVGVNAFNPKGSATRAEVAAMLHRFTESIKQP